jgi:hypothetical protein
MTKSEQLKLSSTLMRAVEGLYFCKVHEAPESWTGIELRTLLADCASAFVFPMAKDRMAAYEAILAEMKIPSERL